MIIYQITFNADDVITQDTPGIVERAAGDTFGRGADAHNP